MKRTVIICLFMLFAVILFAGENIPQNIVPQCFNGWVSTGSNKSFEISAAKSYSVPTRIGTVEMGSNISLAPYFRQKGISLGKSPEDVLPVIQNDDAFLPVNKPVSYRLNKNMNKDGCVYQLNYLACFFICRENPQYCIKMQFSSFYYYRDGTMVLDGVYVFKRDTPFTTTDSFFRYVRNAERDYENDEERILKWSTYTQEEKDFCILSFPYLRFWAMEVADLKVNSKKALDKLNQVWNINSRTELLQFIVDSKANRTVTQPAGLFFQMFFTEEDINYTMITASDYNLLKSFLDKYTDIDTIAISECLDIRDITALYFIQKMRDRLGEHGLLAWDYGLYLVMLRLALSVDWITEEEALLWAKPFIEELYAAYSSWEDYAAHFAIGFGLDENYLADNAPICFVRTRHMVDSICVYDILFDPDSDVSIFSFHNAPFTGTAKNGDPELTYNDVWYNPSYEAELYMSANSYFRYMTEYINTDDQANLKELISKKKNIPAVCYLSAFYKCAGYDLSKNPSPLKVFSAFNPIEPIFKNAVVQSRFYCSFYYDYALMALVSNKINKAFEALEKLNEENRMTPEAQLLYGMYYSIKMGKEKDEVKIAQYAKKILSCFEIAKTRYKLPDEILKAMDDLYNIKF